MNFDISDIPIIDTHEHLADESQRVEQERDVLSLFLRHYLSTDLENAGLPALKIEQLRDPSLPIEKRWQELEPFWQKVSNTAYAQALKIAVHDLYGIEQISRETITELAHRMEEAAKPGFYRKVFQKAGIELALVNDLDHIYDPNHVYETPFPRPSDPPELFKKVINGRALLYIRNKTSIYHMQEIIGGNAIISFQDWLSIIESVFTQFHEAVAVKLPQAYVTSLAVSKRSFNDAERVFNELLGSPHKEDSISDSAAKPLDDYLVHYIIQQALKHNLPIQIHTGLLEGTYNNLQNSNPLNLLPLLMEYKEARFVLFHGSYPWIREFIALGKMFPNVWLDLCWVWVISPRAGRVIMHEIIETIPQNKVTAFGGDYIFIEGSYGHSVMARRNIARVLEEKIEEGWFGMDEAKQYARAILYDNACQLYLKPR